MAFAPPLSQPHITIDVVQRPLSTGINPVAKFGSKSSFSPLRSYFPINATSTEAVNSAAPKSRSSMTRAE